MCTWQKRDRSNECEGMSMTLLCFCHQRGGFEPSGGFQYQMVSEAGFAVICCYCWLFSNVRSWNIEFSSLFESCVSCVTCISPAWWELAWGASYQSWNPCEINKIPTFSQKSCITWHFDCLLGAGGRLLQDIMMNVSKQCWRLRSRQRIHLMISHKFWPHFDVAKGHETHADCRLIPVCMCVHAPSLRAEERWGYLAASALLIFALLYLVFLLIYLSGIYSLAPSHKPFQSLFCIAEPT